MSDFAQGTDDGGAEAAAREAARPGAEAERIGGGTIDPGILLGFETPRQMEAFARAVKDSKIPAAHHRAAMEYATSEGLSVRKMSESLDLWWYARSGQKERDRKRLEKEVAYKRFQKRIREGDFGQYLLKIGVKVRALTSDVKIALPTAPYYENQKHCDRLRGDIAEAIARLEELADTLGTGTGPDRAATGPEVNTRGLRELEG